MRGPASRAAFGGGHSGDTRAKPAGKLGFIQKVGPKDHPKGANRTGVTLASLALTCQLQGRANPAPSPVVRGGAAWLDTCCQPEVCCAVVRAR
jgi:hypothetical protein